MRNYLNLFIIFVRLAVHDVLSLMNDASQSNTVDLLNDKYSCI